jgi:hypothetical protein
MHLIARILIANSSKTNQKRIINKFSSYLLARNVSSTQQQQNEKTIQELIKENGHLSIIAELRQQKQDLEVY